MLVRAYGVGTNIYFPLIDKGFTDFEATPVTIATGDCKISKDGGAFANTGSNFAHVAGGIYSLALTATEMQAKNVVIKIVDQTGTKEWEDQCIVIDTFNHASAEIPSLWSIPQSTASGAITSSSFASGAINAAAIASAAITAAKFAAGAIDAAAIADAAIDNATFAADTGGKTVRSNTAQAGAAGTITLDASASATTDFYVGCLVYLTGGTGAGQMRVITAYNGGTKVATIAPNWATNPDNTSTFAVLAWGNITGVQGNLTGTVGTVNALAAGVITAASIASAAITSAKFASGAIDATAIAADAIGASELATDAVTEIVAAVWDLATSGHTTAGTFGAQVKTLMDTIAGYIDTEVAAIKAKTDNLPSDPADASDIAALFVTVNSKLDAIDDYVDTEVAAIKAKTDLIPASPAAVSDIPTAIQNADALMIRDVSNTEASAAIHSIASVILKLTGKFVGSTGKTYRTDGVTTHMTQIPTTDPAADPITGLGNAS